MIPYKFTDSLQPTTYNDNDESKNLASSSRSSRCWQSSLPLVKLTAFLINNSRSFKRDHEQYIRNPKHAL